MFIFFNFQIARAPRKRKISDSEPPSTSNDQEQAGPSSLSLPVDTYMEFGRNLPVALSLHYISPREYEYVRQQFNTCLPHPKTLARWYKTVNAEPGFCTEAFNAIKLYCNANDGPISASLMVDSMSIKQDVKWDGTRHVGYVNYGVDYNDDSVPHAKEALVFLLNCLNGSWKYPIAYFFVAGVTGEQLAGLVRQCLSF